MKVKVTLPNGMTFEGEKADIRNLLDTSGFTVKGHNYYYSKSRGLIDVHDMDTNHIKNALLKLYREWVAALSTESDPQKVFRAVVDGPADQEQFVTLLSELRTRRS